MLFKKYFIKTLGSKKSYLFLKMELAIILSIVISIFYTFFGGFLLLLQLVPAAMLLLSFNELYRDHRKEFWIYFLIFSVLFVLILVTPYFFRMVSMGTSNPFTMLKYVAYLALGLLLLLILSKTFSPKKEIEGKVILADKNTAVVEVDVDLLAGIRQGRYVVKNNGAKKGNLVRVAVKRGLLRGAHLDRVIGKVRA
jgi:uncharacterized membrane protein